MELVCQLKCRLDCHQDDLRKYHQGCYVNSMLIVMFADIVENCPIKAKYTLVKQAIEPKTLFIGAYRCGT